MKTITEIRLIIYGEAPQCRQRKHCRFSGQKRPQSNVNISSTLTLFERVNSRRVTYMDWLTSPCARHGQTIRELMHITDTSLKHMRGLEHIAISIRGSSIIGHRFLMAL